MKNIINTQCVNNTKIIFAIPDLGSGGAERVVSILVNNLTEQGWIVEILMMFGRNNIYQINDRIEISELDLFGKSKIDRLLYLRKYLRRQKKAHKNLIVISFQITCLKYLLLSRIGLKIRIVSSERNNPYRNGASTFHKIKNALPYLLSNFCVFQTPAARDYYFLLRDTKCVIIPNPITESSYIWRANLSPARLIMVCRLATQKNIFMALNVIRILKSEFTNIHVDIYGEGPLYSRLLNQIEQMELNENVSLKGLTNNVHEIMAESSVYLSTSDYEGISNSMLEAMSVGLPIISTDCPIGGARMMLNNGAGILVPVGDECIFAKELKELLVNDSKAKVMSAKALEISKSYTPLHVTNRWRDVILKILG